MGYPGRPLKSQPRINDLRSNIEKGDYLRAKKTLKEFGIDAKDGDGRTALINAVIENKLDFVLWLIEEGADINHQDRTGYTPLHFCAQEKLENLAVLLLEKGANANVIDIYRNTPLWTAVFNAKGNLGIVKQLLKYKADPDIVNKAGRTPRLMFQTFYNVDINTIYNID